MSELQMRSGAGGGQLLLQVCCVHYTTVQLDAVLYATVYYSTIYYSTVLYILCIIYMVIYSTT